MATGGLLDGKVAFITGAAQGIGLAVARAYVDHGARVMLADVAADKLAAAADGLGDGVRAVALDVIDEDATAAALEATRAAFGQVDVVVPNAGILVLKHAIDTSVEEFRRVLDINLTGAFITAKVFARAMVEQGSGGRIIMTSSLFGLRGGRENAAYSASKFGIVGLVECMAAELASHDISVNCVCPGQMDTDMIRQLFRDRAALTGQTPEAVRGALEGRIPLGRLGGLDQLAGTYVYLASHLSDYVTGQAISVEGGWQVG